jgi:hypothetical protein
LVMERNSKSLSSATVTPPKGLFSYMLSITFSVESSAKGDVPIVASNHRLV